MCSRTLWLNTIGFTLAVQTSTLTRTLTLLSYPHEQHDDRSTRCTANACQCTVELMELGFIEHNANVIFLGPNGVGKSMLAQNLAYQAVMRGHSAVFVTAAKMLGDLSSQDGAAALQRRLRYYARPDVLVIDELGYLSYSDRHADLLFEIVNRRYEKRPIVITTNRPFSEWNEVFPNAPCVVSIVDRLVHHSEIQCIEAQSYRMHEASLRVEAKPKRKPAGKKP